MKKRQAGCLVGEAAFIPGNPEATVIPCGQRCWLASSSTCHLMGLLLGYLE
jgi:hypothetical protein